MIETEIIIEYYVGQKKSAREIEEFVGISRTTILNRLRKAGIKIDPERNKNKNMLLGLQKARLKILEDKRKRWGFETIEEMNEYFEVNRMKKPKLLEMWKGLR